MAVTSKPISQVKAPVITFDEEQLELDVSADPRGVWRDISIIVYALEGRGKSTFLKSVVDAWGPASIVALDIERRLGQQSSTYDGKTWGMPRVALPDMTQYPEEEHYARLLAWWDVMNERAEKRASPFNENSRVIAMDTFNTLYDKIYHADLIRRYHGKGVPREQWKYQFQWYDALYGDIMKRWRRTQGLTKFGYSVIFNAHVKRTKRQIDGEEVDQYEPALPPALTLWINREIHCIFYLKAGSGENPNYFITTPINDTIPAKDQTGIFPRRFWPTWAAIEAIQLGNEWKDLKPLGIKYEVKKEEKK